MKYFPQRNETDCLLACVENLVQHPREGFAPDLIEWKSFYFGNKEQRYLTYSSVSNIMCSGGIVPLVKCAYHNNKLYLNDSPAIVATYYEGSGALHAMFFDGEKIYDPWSEEFYSAHSLKVVYSIFDARQQKVNHDSLLAPPVLHRWDKNSPQSGQTLSPDIQGNLAYMEVNLLNERLE